jgi:hypothetical protein
VTPSCHLFFKFVIKKLILKVLDHSIRSKGLDNLKFSVILVLYWTLPPVASCSIQLPELAAASSFQLLPLPAYSNHLPIASSYHPTVSGFNVPAAATN